MVSVPFPRVQNVHLIFFLIFISIILCVSSLDIAHHDHHLQRNHFIGTRRMLEEESSLPIKNLSSKNKTKLIKPNSSPKNQTKIFKSTNSTQLTGLSKSELKKLNSTSSSLKFKNLNSNSTNLKLKKLNSTSSSLKFKNLISNSTNSKLKKLNSTSKPTNFTNLSPIPKKTSDLTKSNSEKIQNTEKNSKKSSKKQSWLEQDDDDDDFVSDIKDLPMKFQQTLIPDLEKISTTSQAYITRYNKEITRNFKPIVGKKYAPTIATVVLCAFILIPLILVSLVFNRIKTYFSMQKLLIFIQIYLCIYFSILCLSSLVTGLEPLRFFYATSQSTYVCVQVLQTLGYVLYLLMLMLYLTLVFSTSCGLGAKMVGLAQTIVGFGVGLHYYVAVFHRMVLRQPPKTNWKVHGIYATCFLLICLCSNAEGRKKAYLEESGEEGKKN